MSQHAPFSPSGMERVIRCPASHLEEKKYTDSAREYSAEGTFAHSIREACLTEGKDAEEFVGHTDTVEGFTFTWTKSDANLLQPGIDAIRDRGGEWYFEHRVSAERWVKNMWGTLDAGCILPDLIIIDDLKWGRGVRVSAVRLIQLIIYALAFWDSVAKHKTKATKFLLRVNQPRIFGGDTEWYTSLPELLAIMENEIIPACEIALGEDPPFNPGPKACAFCRVGNASACHALDEYVLDLLGIDADLLEYQTGPLDLPNMKKLSMEDKVVLMENNQLIKNYFGKLYFNLLEAGLAGEKVPGQKVVDTLGDRTWIDEEEAEKFLVSKMPAHQAYTRKILSPAQAENVLGTRNWAKAAKMIHRPEGRPALVPESDPRPARIPATELFDDLDSDFADVEDLI